MRRNGFCFTLTAITLLLVAGCASKPALSQNDAVSGTWTGDYGPSPDRRDPVSLELRWKDDKLSGTVRAASRSLPLSTASFKADTGAIAMEFDAPGNNGQTVHYKIEGKVEGNAMTGSWGRDGQSGDFHVTRQ